MIVLDTNILVYATLEDSEFHKESLELVQREDTVIPFIVVYEYIKVLLELTNNPSFVKEKIKELENFNIIQESLGIIYKGVEMLIEDNASLRSINDYIILSTAIYSKAKLATFDKDLRKRAQKRGVEVIPY